MCGLGVHNAEGGVALFRVPMTHATGLWQRTRGRTETARIEPGSGTLLEPARGATCISAPWPFQPRTPMQPPSQHPAGLPGLPRGLKVTPLPAPSPPHLAAADDVGVLREQIHHLAFALVAPLRPQHHRHPVPAAGPRLGAAAVAIGQGRRCRVGLGERHGERPGLTRARGESPEETDGRGRRGREGWAGTRARASERADGPTHGRNCSAAASHMRRKSEPKPRP